jgi:CBS domain-containing protein
MAKLARDVMTPDPACCSPNTTLDQVARMMAQNDCGEIPIIDSSNRPVGVVTDRDIVCRSVAEGKNPAAHTAESVMTRSVVTVRANAPLDDAVSTMRDRQIRRILVVDDDGCCTGIIALADVATETPLTESGGLVREVSRPSGAPAR